MQNTLIFDLDNNKVTNKLNLAASFKAIVYLRFSPDSKILAVASFGSGDTMVSLYEVMESGLAKSSEFRE